MVIYRCADATWFILNLLLRPVATPSSLARELEGSSGVCTLPAKSCCFCIGEDEEIKAVPLNCQGIGFEDVPTVSD